MTMILPKGSADAAFVLSLFIAAGFSWYFGQKWNMGEELTEVDPKSKRIVKVKNNHSLFLIPLQYWGFIFSGFAILILYQNSVLLATICLIVLAVLVFLRFQKKPKELFEATNQPIHARSISNSSDRNKVEFSEKQKEGK